MNLPLILWPFLDEPRIVLFVLLGMPEVLIKRAIDTVLDSRGEE